MFPSLGNKFSKKDPILSAGTQQVGSHGTGKVLTLPFQRRHLHLHHEVDLFECPPQSLGYEEVHKKET